MKVVRQNHWKWLEEHLREVNAAFEIELQIDTLEAREQAENCIEIYDTEEDFNNAFEGVYLRREYAFEILSDEGYAACLSGKYVYFSELHCTYYQYPE